MRRITHLSAALLGLALVTGAGAPGTTSAQMLVGLRAEWGDLETWTHAIESSRESELGMGLHLTGPTGMTLVAFMGRLSARDPRTPPRDLDVQVSTGKMTNPTLLRRGVLSFTADEGTARSRTIDLGANLKVDDPSPGAVISDGVSRIDASDFLRLASATTIRGNVLGFEITFRQDQISALKAFATRLQFRVDSK
jgi:hypothetical protein